MFGMSPVVPIVIFSIAIIILIIVVLLLTFLYSVRTRNDMITASQELQQEIHDFRAKRYESIQQVVRAFGAGNPYTESLKKLAAIYTKVKTEDQELQWEEKYISIMHSFMDYASQNVPIQLQGSYDMANNALIGNEQALENARAELSVVEQKIASYQKQPMQTILQIGEKVSNIVRRTNDGIQEAKTQNQENQD